MKAVVDISVHIFTFKQFDQFYAGRYKLRGFLLVPLQKSTRSARPVHFYPPGFGERCPGGFESAVFSPSGNWNVEVNGLVVFRFEVPCQREDLRSATLRLQFLLKDLPQSLVGKYPPQADGFSVVSSCDLQLMNPIVPISEFCDVLFDDLLSVNFSLSVYSALLGFSASPDPEAPALPQGVQGFPVPPSLKSNQTSPGKTSQVQQGLYGAQANHVSPSPRPPQAQQGLYGTIGPLIQKGGQGLKPIFGLHSSHTQNPPHNFNSANPHAPPGFQGLADLLIRESQGKLEFLEQWYFHFIQKLHACFSHYARLSAEFLREAQHSESNPQRLSAFKAELNSIPLPTKRVPGIITQILSEAEGVQPRRVLDGAKAHPNSHSSPPQPGAPGRLATPRLAGLPSGSPRALEALATAIEREAAEWAAALRALLDFFHRLVWNFSRSSNNFLQRRFHSEQERLLSLIRFSESEGEAFWKGGAELTTISRIARDHRREAKQPAKQETFRIRNLSFWVDEESDPVLFEERFRLSSVPGYREADERELAISFQGHLGSAINPLLRPPEGRHLIVLVHGLGGSELDMRNYKNQLAKIYPNSDLFTPVANKRLPPEADLAFMSKNLAEELESYVRSVHPAGLAKLSFIAHSLGGLVVRGALPNLKFLHKNLFTFMSLGSPHLGIASVSSNLVNFGVKMLKEFGKYKVLSELDLTDSKDPYKSALFRLSTLPDFGLFKNYVFVSSRQDGYSPLESAQILITPEIESNKTLGPLLTTMAQNIFSSFKSKQITRFTIDIRTDRNLLDNLTGKTAHIEITSSPKVAQAVLYRFTEYFNQRG